MKCSKSILRMVCALLCLIAVVAGTFYICEYFFPKQTWKNGSPWPENMDETCLSVEDYTQKKRQIILNLPPCDEPLSLVISQATPFTLTIGGEVIYKYTTEHPYQRLHTIPLPETQEELEVALQGGSMRIMLGTTETINRFVSQTEMINNISIGMQLIVLIYALSLYISKPSEHYLLSLAALTLGNFVLTLLCSSHPSALFTENAFRMLQTPLVMLLRVLTVCCCMLISPFLLGRVRKRFFVLGAAVLYGVMLLFHFTGPDMITRILIDGLPFVGIGVLLLGYARRKANTLLPLIGLALLTGVNQYYQAYAQQSSSLRGAMPAFLYVWQFGCILFIFFLMLATNRRFGQKFAESEQLTITLDQRVQQRTAELEAANAQIREEQQQRSQTMLNLLHDLRTPIFSALGCAEMLQAHYDQETMDILAGRLGALNHLAEDLFLVAKLQESKITFVLSEEPLQPVVTDIGAHAAVRAAERGITLHLEVLATPTVTADPFRLRQALENLVDNAFHYTPDGGTITLRLTEAAGEAAISVSDTGKGIAPEDLPHIFERYYHSGNQRSTGLGLTIAHEIITALNGRIEAQSQQGDGTTFTVYLPLTR